MTLHAKMAFTTRYTTVYFKALSDQVCIIYQCLQFSKLIIFNFGFSTKEICAFLLQKNIEELSESKFSLLIR